MIIALNVVFIVLIVLVVYWFWLYKPSKAKVVNKGGVIDVVVDNGIYTPASVQTNTGQRLRLRFTRKAASPCASTVVFADFDQSAQLPLNQAVMIELVPKKVGRFDFTCEMGMYRGQLVVL
jgi:plastocyanin domain-containing protein